MHLNAARQLMKRVPFADVLQAATEDSGDETDMYEDAPEFWAKQLERRGIRDVTAQQALSDARKFRELEYLVRALDSLETVASLAELTNEYVLFAKMRMIMLLTGHREQKKKAGFWPAIGEEVKNTKENMQPLLKNWLLVGIEGKSIHTSKTPPKLTIKQKVIMNYKTFVRLISPRQSWHISVHCTSQALACPGTTFWNAWSSPLSLQSVTRIFRQRLWKLGE